MKIEQAKKLADQALERLIQAVEQGGSEALKTYLSAMARFHAYSFTNSLLIIMQRPEATKVAGYRTWQKLKRFVKKGEKGIVIIAPMLVKPKNDVQAEASENEYRMVLRFKAAYVFDIAQTEGEPLPEFAKVNGNPNGHTDRLKAFIAKQGIALEYSAEIGIASGLSAGGKIILRPDLTPAKEFSVLVHELAHELLHKAERRKDTTRTIRETEAEAVAFVVCQTIGLDTSTAASDYIQLYDGDKATLSESLDLIHDTACSITEAITEHD